MTDVRRDAALAVCCSAVFLAFLAVTGTLASLLDPPVAAVGVGVALVAEGVFFVDDSVGDVWDRPWVRAGGAAVLLLGVALATVRVGPRVVAAACWGLLTYFAILALALSGYWPVDRESADG